jgi:predicted ATPase
MKLERFRISNYRSVKDSGWIDTGQRTVLVGRNESGKSNVLLALATLKPLEKLERLSAPRDFPADLPPNSCTPGLGVVETVWALSEPERRELEQILPRAAGVTHVEVGRGYEPEYWVRFPSAAESTIAVSPRRAKSTLPNPVAAVEGSETPETSVGADQPPALDYDSRDLYEPLAEAVVDSEATEDALTVLDSLGADPATTDHELDPTAQHAEDGGSTAEKEAREWVIERLPTFLYVDEYPEVEGSQNLSDYVRFRQEGRLEARHKYFEKLLSVAGLDPSAAEVLLTSDSGMRRQIVSHAGRVLTQKLREFWTDRALKVRFDLDGEQFNTLVCDANSTYDVEINLNERSRGFRWFFSFYVAFAAHSGDDGETLLLLDEPAVHLHAVGQRDFLNHLTSSVAGQVVLATQSPFMVPTDDLSCVRTVTISEEDGTCVSNEPAGDAATMIPIVHALGSEISKALLDDSWSLVVEGFTDYWYLLGASNVLREAGSSVVPSKLSITPAGNTATVLYMTGLLSSGGVPAVVLQSNRDTIGKALSGGSDENRNVIFIADALLEAPPGGADVEDLLDPQTYDRFVRIAHKNRLKERELEFDGKITRLVPRYEDAFRRAGLTFSRERVARAFVRMLLQNADSALPSSSRARFERLFAMISERFEALRD